GDDAGGPRFDRPVPVRRQPDGPAGGREGGPRRHPLPAHLARREPGGLRAGRGVPGRRQQGAARVGPGPAHPGRGRGDGARGAERGGRVGAGGHRGPGDRPVLAQAGRPRHPAPGRRGDRLPGHRGGPPSGGRARRRRRGGLRRRAARAAPGPARGARHARVGVPRGAAAGRRHRRRVDRGGRAAAGGGGDRAVSEGGGPARTVRAGRRSVRIRRPDKVFFPGGRGTPEYTKGDLADYHRAVAPYLLPHLRGRPLMLDRRPDGIDGPAFMQKNTPEHYPEWITRIEVGKEGGTVTHTVCDDTATLLHLVDQAAVTLHRWLSRAGPSRSRQGRDGTDPLERPDRLVFDLDPSGEGRDAFETVRWTARVLGELLDELRLPSALMTTGSRGLHVIVPLDRGQDF